MKATAKLVTAVNLHLGTSEFYIQEPKGHSGIRVVSETSVQCGDLVTIVGGLTTESGELTICLDVDFVGHVDTPLLPLFIPNRLVGGGSVESLLLPGFPVVLDSDTLGFLIRTCGRVTYDGRPSNPDDPRPVFLC